MVSVLMLSHSYTCTTSFMGAILASASHFAVIIYLIKFKNSKFSNLVVMLSLLRLGECLLFPFLGTTSEAKHKVKCTFLLNVII